MRNSDGPSGAEPDEMNALIDAEVAERILTGEAVAPPPLLKVLRAAAAPPDAYEFAGEDAAVRSFRIAREHRTAPGGQPRPVAGHRALPPARPARHPAWARAAIKVAAAFFILTAGGIAVAAGVSAISEPLPGQSSARPNDTSYGSPRGTASNPGLGPAATPGPTKSPFPAAFGQCQAFQADRAVDRRMAEQNPRYAQLIAAAGGLDKVDAYCETVVHPGATNQPSHSEHRTANSSKRPQGNPSPDHKAAPASQPEG